MKPASCDSWTDDREPVLGAGGRTTFDLATILTFIVASAAITALGLNVGTIVHAAAAGLVRRFGFGRTADV